MKRCKLLTQEEIKNAFDKISNDTTTNIISKIDLTQKLAKELDITTGQLKSTHLLAFLNCYMKDLGWELQQDTETFRRIELDNSGLEVIRALKAAGWTKLQIDVIHLVIIVKLNNHVSDAEIDSDEVKLYNGDDMYHFRKKEIV